MRSAVGEVRVMMSAAARPCARHALVSPSSPSHRVDDPGGTAPRAKVQPRGSVTAAVGKRSGFSDEACALVRAVGPARHDVVEVPPRSIQNCPADEGANVIAAARLRGAPLRRPVRGRFGAASRSGEGRQYRLAVQPAARARPAEGRERRGPGPANPPAIWERTMGGAPRAPASRPRPRADTRMSER